MLTGHISVVIVSSDNLDPSTIPSFSIPLVMTVYVASHSSPLIITIAIPLIIGALPEIQSKGIKDGCNIVHTCKLYIHSNVYIHNICIYILYTYNNALILNICVLLHINMCTYSVCS